MTKNTANLSLSGIVDCELGAWKEHKMEMMGFSHFELVGLAGVGFYLGSYAALQLGFLRGSSYTYAACNFIAASLVLISLIQDFNLSSAIIQISWIVISTYGIIRLYYIRNSMRFSIRERAMLNSKFPGLSNDLASTFLKSGNWQKLFAPKTLIREGQSVETFYFIHSGSADIVKDGRKTAICEAGDFLGEVTCFSGEPATGSVILSEDAELFAIDTEILRRIAPVGSSLRDAIENAIANDLRVKMTRKSIPAAEKEFEDYRETSSVLRDLDLITAA